MYVSVIEKLWDLLTYRDFIFKDTTMNDFVNQRKAMTKSLAIKASAKLKQNQEEIAKLREKEDDIKLRLG